MRYFILLTISAILLLACNQTKREENRTVRKEQINVIEDKSVALSVEPDIFMLSDIPDTIMVKITNNTNDTISTGLHYRIECYENDKWKEVSPKDILFHDLGWRLKPTESENFEKKLFKDKINYKTGKYRIVKYYLKSDYQKTKKTYNIYGYFEIK
ncbi:MULTISPECIES: immunoglobulin-like domain-containing protein [Sphingobacterium]|uniref:immunoglobulin-like domain-containing protein n=1 Tax=Sphingobacterium TaxID=28453 RepID=UPI00257CE81B|nr:MULTISPECIES: immunoglobulin-like domain-containing protein [Sphingobacterium]